MDSPDMLSEKAKETKSEPASSWTASPSWAVMHVPTEPLSPAIHNDTHLPLDTYT